MTQPLGAQLGSTATRYVGRGPKGVLHTKSVRHLAISSDAVGGGKKTAQRRESQGISRLARLEAVLFLARQPLTTRKLAQLANLADGTEARTLVQRLDQQYETRGSAFQVVHVAGGYRLLTRPQLAPWLRRLGPGDEDIRLSAPAMETLAVVAYRQPVARAEVEAVRGVQCGELLRQLMERDLLRIVGRSEELGRPFLYGTTRRFLQAFGLRNLDELPRAARLRSADAAPQAA